MYGCSQECDNCCSLVDFVWATADAVELWFWKMVLEKRAGEPALFPNLYLFKSLSFR